MNILQFGMSLDLTEAELMYSRNDTDGIKHAIRNQFTKKFSLPTYIHHSTKIKHHCNAKCQRKPGFKLPNTSRWFQKSNKNWDDAKLVSMKADLNKIKSLLNEKPLIEWHRHTRFRNPAADVISRIREVGENPELLTQVKEKMYIIQILTFCYKVSGTLDYFIYLFCRRGVSLRNV